MNKACSGLFLQSVKTETGKKQQTESFAGHANYKDDAKMSAEVKYSSWRVDKKKEGKPIEELSKDYTYRQINDVHWRCEISVTYTIASA